MNSKQRWKADMIHYQHLDQLKQPIELGQPIAFTCSYVRGVRVGVVKKLTRRRVKIHYKYNNIINNERVTGCWDILIEPSRTIQLGVTLPPTITMFLLKNGN
jgi:hypothetical protein